jgi:hypothetical protein
MSDHMIQAKRWRERAEEMRVVGETMRDKVARADLLKAASTWENMAGRAEANRVPSLPKGRQKSQQLATTVTCACGARYRRTVIRATAPQKDKFECFVCQSQIETWEGVYCPHYELISRPNKMSAG